MWFLFVALLVPAGVVGWAIGHSTAGGTKTVTVGAGAATTGGAVTTAAPATTAAATAPATTAAATTTPGSTTVAAAAGGNAAAGKAVFSANGCASCHTFKPAAATGTVGPDLDSRPAQDAKKANMPFVAFVRESIVKPDAYIAPGYSKGIMPTTFGSSLSKTQLADLVAFIVSGKS